MIKKEKKQENLNKKILIISDSFENETSSVSKHMTDLFIEFNNQGHSVSIISNTPKNNLKKKIYKHAFEIYCSFNLFRKNQIYFLRALNELIFAIQIFFFISFTKSKYDLTVWYSPSIFIGLGIKLSLFNNKLGKKVLILRDIFPDWLVHLGILNQKSIKYKILKIIESYQFQTANIIFVQSKIDCSYVKKQKLNFKTKVKILYSWFTIYENNHLYPTSVQIIDLQPYLLFIGNLGEAQNQNAFLKFLKNLVKKGFKMNIILLGLKNREFNTVNNYLKINQIKNVFIFKPVNQSNIPKICRKAVCGLYSLNEKFISNNIPGRFVMYALNGLKSFGFFDKNKELEEIIQKYSLGEYSSFKDPLHIKKFLNFVDHKNFNKESIKKNSEKIFSTSVAANTIISQL